MTSERECGMQQDLHADHRWWRVVAKLVSNFHLLVMGEETFCHSCLTMTVNFWRVFVFAAQLWINSSNFLIARFQLIVLSCYRDINDVSRVQRKYYWIPVLQITYKARMIPDDKACLPHIRLESCSHAWLDQIHYVCLPNSSQTKEIYWSNSNYQIWKCTAQAISHLCGQSKTLSWN